MKAVILAGGFGTRLSEETAFRPKLMVEIGSKLMLWHIINIYAAQGVNAFSITLRVAVTDIEQVPIAQKRFTLP